MNDHQTGRLQDKVVIITGAAGGQGSAASRIFAQEGARVAMLDLDENSVAKSAAEIGAPGLLPVQCNVADSASVQSAVARVLQEFGRVDVLYNNAGTNFRRPGPWDETQDGPTIDVTEELFDRSIGVNLKGPFLMSKYVLPHMVEREQGSIINVASLAGPFIGAKNNVYAAAKAGVVGLTKALAQTYGPHGIRVNAIAPGLIETPMVANMLADDAARAGYEAGTPLRRLGQPQDIARVALFLASDDSGFVTGTLLTADAGYLVR